MEKPVSTPKISDQEAEKITEAAQFAYGNQSADEIMDQAFAWVRKRAEARQKNGHQTVTE